MADPVPRITGASEFDVFLRVVGNIPPGDLPVEWLFDMLMRIGPSDHGEWAFLPGFDRMMGSYDAAAAWVTRPTTLPPLQWSQHAMIPRMVFRRLHVPMMILDPQEERDHLPVTDQNERLANQNERLAKGRCPSRTSIRCRPSAMRVVVAVFARSAGRDHAVQRDVFDDFEVSHSLLLSSVGIGKRSWNHACQSGVTRATVSAA